MNRYAPYTLLRDLPSSILLKESKGKFVWTKQKFFQWTCSFFEKKAAGADSVVEETVTGDYALIINGHSLVSSLKAFVISFSPPQ